MVLLMGIDCQKHHFSFPLAFFQSLLYTHYDMHLELFYLVPDMGTVLTGLFDSNGSEYGCNH